MNADTPVPKLSGHAFMAPQRLSAIHLVVAAVTLLAFAGLIATRDPVAYTTTLLLPVAVIIVARTVAAVVARRRREQSDAAGYAVVALAAAALTLASLAWHSLPGPATLVPLGVAALGRAHRDRFTTVVSLAAAFAVAPLDIFGPLRADLDDSDLAWRVAAILVVAVILVAVSVWRLQRAGVASVQQNPSN